MRITVDRSKCLGMGICESLAPDVFALDAAGTLSVTDEIPAVDAEAVAEAIACCPTEALRAT